MAGNIDHLKLFSFNCRGFNDLKKNYLKSVLNSCDILFLQEHWQTDAQIPALNLFSSDHYVHGVSGFDQCEVLRGRPYGGCAIFWRQNLNVKTSFVDTGSRRVCAVRCNFTFGCLILINVYMPYEDDEASSEEFRLQLSIIGNIIEQNVDCQVILGGDFNVDFDRDWSHTNLLLDFCNEFSLHPSVNHELNKIDYSYNFSMKRFQIVDHFIISELLYKESVTKIDVCHDIENTSDHDPIRLELSLKVTHFSTCDRQFVPKVAWYKAKPADMNSYSELLRHKLATIDIPVDSVLCHDVFCCDSKHCELLNNYIRDISEACLQSAKDTIPHTTAKKDGCVPGWSEFVDPAKSKSLFWHNIWLECGKPKTGIIADIMRKTRALYHYAVRNVKKNEQLIVNDNFANAIIGNRNRDFWSEIKRMRRSARSCSNVIDDITNPLDISNLFASKYQELYTSVPFDSEDLSLIKSDISVAISHSGFDSNSIFNFAEIKEAVHRLKPGKSDGNLGLGSDYFINACDELYVHISFLFSSLAVHGVVPNDMLTSTVIPIPKGRNANVTDSSNYRGITLSSIFCKLFDILILSRYGDCLCSSDYQFGFKAKRSTDMCTMILKESLSYYVNNGGSAYCTFLDATKAFDRVEYCKLFRQLMSRGLPPVIIRLLLNMYVGHVTRVEWNGIFSQSFSVRNGVKQGGIVSPVLFCVYIDGLLQSLANLGVGCFMGDVFVGILAYADDIVLIAPTPNALRLMLSKCDTYANDFKVVFNASKSKCLFLTNRRRRQLCLGQNPVFELNGQPIEYVDKWSHLGHIISDDLDDKADILQRRNVMAGQINNVLCYFGKLDYSVKIKLLKSYCSSLYGSVLWDLSNPCIESVCTSWRHGLRRIFGLPYNAHSFLLPVLSCSLPVIDELFKRSVLFAQRCLTSDCALIRSVAFHSVVSSPMQSPMGKNVILSCLHYNVVIDDFMLINYRYISNFVFSKIDNDTFLIVNMLLELFSVRSGNCRFTSSNLSVSDSQLLIDWMSTL